MITVLLTSIMLDIRNFWKMNGWIDWKL